MGWRERLGGFVERLFGIEERMEAAEPPPKSSFDFDKIIPEIGSLPDEPNIAEPESPQIEDVADFIDLLDLKDSYAQDLLEKGWFDSDISADMRHDAREAFFEYTGYEEDEFPWEEWREWYDSQ